ncbi:MAG TPA: hypothetical protein VI893_10385 [Thermoplasmata archaeon]|nr:hypothetical protein [Thermoplasmata archaeon]
MRTYLDLWFASDGEELVSVVKRLEGVGLKTIIGIHDFYFDWRDDTEFKTQMGSIHKALKGTKTLYKTHTITEDEVLHEAVKEASFVLPYR